MSLTNGTRRRLGTGTAAETNVAVELLAKSIATRRDDHETDPC